MGQFSQTYPLLVPHIFYLKYSHVQYPSCWMLIPHRVHKAICTAGIAVNADVRNDPTPLIICSSAEKPYLQQTQLIIQSVSARADLTLKIHIQIWLFLHMNTLALP